MVAISFPRSSSISRTECAEKSAPDNLAHYPDEVLYKMLLHCDKKTLLSARLTCKRFDIVLNNTFWREKCEVDNVALPPKNWRRFLYSQNTSFDYMYIYFHHNPYSPNALARIWNKHPDEHQQEIAPFGRVRNVWLFGEAPPNGSQFTDDITACYVTSYGWGERLFTIDLLKLGVEEWVLDHLRPRIVVKEWHAPRDDCGCTYELHAQLLKDEEIFNRTVELPRFKKIEKNYVQWNGGVWAEEELVFENYPHGIRKLAIASRGKDSQFRQGEYGAKFTNTTVRIEFDGEPRILQKMEYPDGPKKVLNSNEPHPRFYGRHMVPDMFFKNDRRHRCF